MDCDWVKIRWIEEELGEVAVAVHAFGRSEG